MNMAQPTVDNSSRWLMGSLCAIAVVFGIAWAMYPSIPDPMPTHWNAAGVPDNFAKKAPTTYFGLILLGPGTILLTQLFVQLVTSSSQDSERARLLSLHTRQVTNRACTALIVLVGALVLWANSGNSGPVDIWIFLLLVLLLVIWMVRMASQVRKHVDAIATPEHYDPSKFRGPWYWDPQDPRMIVDDAAGNVILNFARPSAWALCAGITAPALLIVALAVLAG